MAGGTWTSQNKVLPGVYIRFKTGQALGLTVGDRGVVTICEPISWGPVGVARRTLSVNSRYIRGYCLPDYASKAESEVDEIVSYDDWKKYMEQYLTERRDNDSSTWSQQARDWAIKTKLVSGGGTMPDGTPNYMWEDLPTREQLVQTLYTFAKLFGLA